MLSLSKDDFAKKHFDKLYEAPKRYAELVSASHLAKPETSSG
ncbi:hypothetical protein GFO_3034 [Christiangramia forsetii KT0803]|uniref:Uncharacterized protein n=1 Tax=Christiangramia forsetii (strain DSM 17595 / CGMCC 1.15422 / KT0803) TaxID=411154 RepID=A0M5T3_CHRFK|nr:hypothetical protein GFO_3034 [Christiangramia forsetii KT0803]